MKEERQVAVIPSGSMSSANVSPLAAYSSPAQAPLQTPSPFAFSVASTGWSSRHPIQTASLSLRVTSLILSFGSALSLVAQSSTNKLKKYPELWFLFAANILVVVYALYQLSKSICDIVHRGIFISDKVSDYISFIFDQLAGYLLISASSVAVQLIRQEHDGNSFSASSVAEQVIRQEHDGNSFWKAATLSVCMSFASFPVIAATALLSGYKLCKRIMW